MVELGIDYRGLSQKYLEDGEKLLQEFDLSQASEKFWGAAACMVKAVAESRDLHHDTHRNLFRVISSLSREYPDAGLNRLFGIAHNLHVNFYENWLTQDQVEDGAKAVRELIERLSDMLPPVEDQG